MSDKKQPRWVRGWGLVTKGYQYLLVVFALLVAANASGLIGASFADTGGQSADGGGFQVTVCAIFGLMGQVVGGVAVVTIIAAGIIYAASGASDKSNVGIGTAKGMITSAIAGVLLFLLSGLLIGDCYSAARLNYGPFLQGILDFR